MSQMDFLRFLGTTPGAGVDWVVVLLFIAIAIVYFLAPVLGYRAGRSALAGALYLLVGYAGVSLGKLFLDFTQVNDRSSQLRAEGNPQEAIQVLFLFLMVKMFLFGMAMLLFVIGLQSLRLGPVYNPKDENSGRGPGRRYFQGDQPD
jgi:hypothetical protein